MLPSPPPPPSPSGIYHRKLPGNALIPTGNRYGSGVCTKARRELLLLLHCFFRLLWKLFKYGAPPLLHIFQELHYTSNSCHNQNLHFFLTFICYSLLVCYSKPPRFRSSTVPARTYRKEMQSRENLFFPQVVFAWVGKWERGRKKMF